MQNAYCVFYVMGELRAVKARQHLAVLLEHSLEVVPDCFHHANYLLTFVGGKPLVHFLLF